MNEPRWAVMCLAASTVYGACKGLTWYTAVRVDVPGWRQAAYLLVWPGMDADAFLSSRRLKAGCPATEWLSGLRNVGLGATLLFVAAPAVDVLDPYVLGWIGMIGLVLGFHFGALHLLSCLWRQFSVEARPVMNRPLASASLGEFWGRRWNTAFRDLTHRFLFRPLAYRFGPRPAALAGFIVSGIVHDFVISWPAGGGYGGPTLFFTVQGLAVNIERSARGRRLGLGRGVAGRLFAAVVLVAPLGLLFHRPFVLHVIIPLMHAIGALS